MEECNTPVPPMGIKGEPKYKYMCRCILNDIGLIQNYIHKLLEIKNEPETYAKLEFKEEDIETLDWIFAKMEGVFGSITPLFLKYSIAPLFSEYSRISKINSSNKEEKMPNPL